MAQIQGHIQDFLKVILVIGAGWGLEVQPQPLTDFEHTAYCFKIHNFMGSWFPSYSYKFRHCVIQQLKQETRY